MTQPTSPEWEREYRELTKHSQFIDHSRIIAFIRQAIAEAVKEERMRILEALPKQELVYSRTQVRATVMGICSDSALLTDK